MAEDERDQTILDRLLAGDLKPRETEDAVLRTFPGLPFADASDRAARIRRAFIERTLGIDLAPLGAALPPGGNARAGDRARIEGCVGAASIPLGVAGPLTVHGTEAQGRYQVPLATNEAALVAGISRAMAILERAGGVATRIEKDGMTRAPLVEARSPESLARALAYLATAEGFAELAAAAAATTRYGRLLDIDSIVDPHHPSFGYLRMRFFTGDAMGMNLATIAAEAACRALTARFPDLAVLALSGNLCSDKKQTRVNVERGRGLSVRAAATVPQAELQRLGVEAARVARVHYHKNIRGGDLAGTIGGYNAHAANPVAAIFCATGQDLAQVVESASCLTDARDEAGSLAVSVYLPSLEVGTVGGGTDTPTARAALRIIGVEGGGDPPGRHRRTLGEVVAATVLAGELNLLTALARGELASSHARMR